MLGILPIVLSSDLYTTHSINRLTGSTRSDNLKTVASTVGSVNHVHMSNKSHIVLLVENSTEHNENIALKEQYELQNETGFYKFNLFINFKTNIYLIIFL